MKRAMQHAAILFFTAAILLFAGCAEESIVSPEVASGENVVDDAAKALGRANGAVTVPFRASFYSIGGAESDPSCGDFPRFSKNTQDGDGEATHLGRFSFHATFCQDIADVLDDGQLTEGESVPYWNGVATLTAANGDELWITVAGAIVLSDHPDYDVEFHDPFEFVGGTGRFEGASGNGVTDSYGVAGRVEHTWSGTLNVLRGK